MYKLAHVSYLSCDQTSICLDLHQKLRVRLIPLNMFKPLSIVLLMIPRWCFFCGCFLLFMFHVFTIYAVLSVPCSLVITCRERADLLTFFVMFYCVFVTFPYGTMGQLWYFIVLISDLCLLLYFVQYMVSNVQKRNNRLKEIRFNTLYSSS